MGLLTSWRAKFCLNDASTDADFVQTLYYVLLCRRPDAEGQAFQLRRLGEGRATRADLVREFIASDECRRLCNIKFRPHQVLRDFVQVADPAPFLPHVAQPPYEGARLCELANPRKWLDEEWMELLLEMGIVSPSLDEIHRKAFEIVQTVYGLRKLGAWRPDLRVLVVGAGHEPLLYWLANQVAEVVATDLYDGSWSRKGGLEGDPQVLADQDKYAPFPYRKECLKFMQMDGRKLEFPDNSFDAVYSLSSIEHFGGHEGSAQSMTEMGRVLKPGGVAAIATEMVLNGHAHKEFFLPGEILEYVVKPAGMPLVQAPEFKVPRVALDDPVQMWLEQDMTPHLVLKNLLVVYTSVMLFFRKPL